MMESSSNKVVLLKMLTGFGLSKSEARRLIIQGAVKVNGIKITQLDAQVDSDAPIVIGK